MRYLLAVLIFAFVLGMLFQGSRGLYDRDETRYSECAREMLASGNFIVPQLDFKPHLTKPPFTYWAIASGMKLFGINEWGARFPNALAFAFTVFLVCLIGKGLWDTQTGLRAGIIYMTTLVPFVASNIVTTDTILVLWEVAAVWAFVRGYKAPGPKQARRWFILMFVFWGIAFLTKGPAIFPVAGGLALFWFLFRDRFKAFPLRPTGLILFVLVGFSWYWGIFRLYPDSVGLVLKEQLIGRLFSDCFHRNSAWYAPLYLYLPILILGSLPWVIWWPKIFRSAPSFRNWQAIRRHPSAFLLFSWWAVPLVVFSLASSRLPLYILPLFAPMALFTARGMKLICKETDGRWNVVGDVCLRPRFLTVWILSLIILKAGSAWVPAPQDARAFYKNIAGLISNNNLILADCDLNLNGLAFYMKKDIEYLVPRADGLCARGEESWADENREIKEDAIPRILIVDDDLKESLETLLDPGICFAEVKQYGDIFLYEVSVCNAWVEQAREKKS